MNIKLLNEIKKYEDLIQQYMNNYPFIKSTISEDNHYVSYVKPFWMMTVRDKNEEGKFGLNNFSYMTFSSKKESCLTTLNNLQANNPNRILVPCFHHKLARITHNLYKLGYFYSHKQVKFDVFLTVPTDKEEKMSAYVQSWPSFNVDANLNDGTYMKYIDFINWSEAEHEN